MVETLMSSKYSGRKFIVTLLLLGLLSAVWFAGGLESSDFMICFTAIASMYPLANVGEHMADAIKEKARASADIEDK